MAMLNCFILLLIFVASLVAGTFYECANQFGCSQTKDEKCCLAKNIPRGKRAAVYGSITTSLPGTCQPYGVEGSSCLVNPTQESILYYKCPCGAGLECVSLNVYEAPLGLVGKCRKPCKSDVDCGQEHCCQKEPQLKGRKKRAADESFCMPYGNYQDSCVLIDPQYPNIHSRCPCNSGLSCQDDGYREVPVDYDNLEDSICHHTREISQRSSVFTL